MYHLKSRWEIPLQATVYGSLSGLLGPVFLLAPLGLLALRRREGRQLWLAALVFGANYFSNITTRFLIPPLPFVALAMMLALERGAVPDSGGGGAVGDTLLAVDCAALCPQRRLAAGQNSLARGAPPPARRTLPGSPSRTLSGGPVDRAEDRARFDCVHLRADSGGLHVAAHTRGIPVGGQPDRREDSVDRRSHRNMRRRGGCVSAFHAKRCARCAWCRPIAARIRGAYTSSASMRATAN